MIVKLLLKIRHGNISILGCSGSTFLPTWDSYESSEVYEFHLDETTYNWDYARKGEMVYLVRSEPSLPDLSYNPTHIEDEFIKRGFTKDHASGIRYL